MLSLVVISSDFSAKIVQAVDTTKEMTKFFIFWPATVPLYGAKAMSTVHLHRGLHKRGWPLPHVCLHDCGQRPP